MGSFAIGDADFLLDGRPHRILSGAIHYFRVHPDLWADRIRKARLMGLNTIETYVAWNAHEPRRGEWDASGPLDLGRFLDLVAAEGMHAIVRPGPYICAEWHNGGLPVWLTASPGIRLRCSDPDYLDALRGYLDRVYEIVAPRQIDAGGPVILVQIENEYGAYGSDADYLRELVRHTRASDITVPLTTVDQPTDEMLRDGSLDELHRTGSFGSRAGERFATLRRHQPTGPLMCSEFWCGWFDWWGGAHHTTDAATAAAELDAVLAAGASVNIYMFHGGTNAGTTAGANDHGRYLPITTSYDYDAPLDESGTPTAKYAAFRDVIARYAPVPDETPPPPSPAPSFTIALHGIGDWLPASDSASLPHPEPAPEPAPLAPTMDELDPAAVLVQYTAALPPGDRARMFAVDEVRDDAWVRVDGRPVGRMSRTHGERSIEVPPGSQLEIIVADAGRVNYGRRLGEPKGLIGAPRLAGRPLAGWRAEVVDLAAAAARVRGVPEGDMPTGRCALRGTFALTSPSDLHLDTGDWGRGYVFVNGWPAGRYRSDGPQRTLYVPGPATRTGDNEIVVLELERPGTAAKFVPVADLGPTRE